MKKYVHILPLLFILLLNVSFVNITAQNESILDFTIKKLDGDTLELREHLDQNSNYIIETMAFWCEPCIRSIDKFNYHKNYWKERFNVNILLIEDEHWDDLEYVENEMQEFGWDLEIVVSDDQYSTVGINSIPRYFFKSAASDTLERVYGNIEKFLIERVDSVKFSSIFDTDFKQVVLEEDCGEMGVYKYNQEDNVVLQEKVYHDFDNMILRENEQNGDLIRFNFDKLKDETYIKYSAALCSRIWLKDREGDSLMVKILDRYQVDSTLHVITDKMIVNECSNEEIPFELIQNIGTNAGLAFDIEEGEVRSRLICHNGKEDVIYTDDELGGMCLSLSDLNIAITDLNIKTYPNPAKSNLTVILNFDGEKKIELCAFNGEKLLSQITDANETEILLPRNMNSSLYFLKISTKYGVMTKKIIGNIQD